MKWYQYLALTINGVAALYFLYTAAIHLFVYFANRSLGHQESFLIPGRNLILAAILSTCTLGAWYGMQQEHNNRLANLFLYFPITVVGLFAMWTIILIVGAGGRWN